MRRLHLSLGVAATLAFLATGQFMRHHTPPLDDLSDTTRLMFRSRHIYILGAAAVNLLLGSYLYRQSAGWRRTVQSIGSALLMASPILLIVAFMLEPARGFHLEMPWSSSGLYALFAGVMAHLISAVVQPEKRT